jgi:hypothetical protein
VHWQQHSVAKALLREKRVQKHIAPAAKQHLNQLCRIETRAEPAASDHTFSLSQAAY